MRELVRWRGPAVAVLLVALVSTQAWAGTPVTGTTLTRLVIFALPLAGIYAISATGLVVVYSATGIFNMAQGAVGMLCAFVYWELSVNRGVPSVLALLIVVCGVAPLIGTALDGALMRRLAHLPLVTQLTATVGLMVALLGIATTIWNPNSSYPIAPLGGGGGIRIAGVLLTWHRVIILAVALGLAVALRFMLFASRIGVAMRAVVDDRDLASLHGIRPGRVSSLAWVIGSMCAALAGILIAPEVGNMSAETLSLLVINAFAAAVIGRLRSLPMTYAGAVLLGLLTAYATTFLELGGRWSSLTASIPAIALFGVLLITPAPPVRLGRQLRTYAVEKVPTMRTALTAGAVLMAVVVAVAPLLSMVNTARLTTGVTVGVILLGLVPLVGWAGVPFFAPYALAGFGAFAAWRLQDDLPWLATLLVAGLVSAAAGIVTALPAIRLRGLYLALSSVALAIVAVRVILAQPEAFSQPRPVARPSVFGIDLAASKALLVFVAATYVVLAVGVVALRRSFIGRRLVAARDSEAAAACLGVDVTRGRVFVFGLAGLISGIGGGLLAVGQQFASLDQFPMIAGLAIILNLMIWGVGTAAGPLAAGLTGSLFVLVHQEWATGDWFRAIELVGPGLAALAMVRHPRGQIPDLAQHARRDPWDLPVRIAGLAVGAAIGVGLALPGLVGVALAFLISAAAGLVRRQLMAHWAGAATDHGDSADDVASAQLGLTQPFSANTVRRLDAFLRVPLRSGASR